MKKLSFGISIMLLLLLILRPAAAQKPVLVLPVGHIDAVTCLNYSADGKYLVSGSKDRTVKLWNQEQRLLRTFTGHDSPLMDVKISPDQRYILSRTDSSYYFWNFNGSLEWRRPAIPPPGTATVTAYDEPIFTSDGTSLLYAEPDDQLILYDLDTHTSTRLSGNARAGFKLSPDEKWILTTLGGELYLYNRKGILKKKIQFENTAAIQFPHFEAAFLNNEQIIVSFSYATEVTFDFPYDFSSGGFSMILNLKGKVQQEIGNPMEIYRDENGALYCSVTLPPDDHGNITFVIQQINPISTMYSTGGLSTSTDRMDWNDLKINAAGNKMVLSNRHFTHLRELPSGRSLMIKKTDQNQQISSYPLGFDAEGKHLAVKSGKELIIYQLDGDAPVAHSLHMTDDFPGSCPFGGWPSPFAFAPDSERIVIGDEKGNIWISNIEAQPVRRYGPPPVTQVVAVHTDDHTTSLIDFYFSGEKIDVSQQGWRQQESPVLKHLFDLAGGRTVHQEQVNRGAVPIKRENEHRSKQWEFSSSYDFGLEDFYNGMYSNLSAGIIHISAPDTDQPPFGFRPSESMFDLGLVQGRYLLTSDFSTKPLLWDLEQLLALRGQAEAVQLYKDQYATLIPAELIPEARLRQFNNLPVRTKYLALGVKQPYALIKKRNKWGRVHKNGYEQYTEIQYLDFQLLNIQNGEILPFSGHPLNLLGATFLPGERQVISWAEDRSCRIWDTESGKELLKLFWITEKDWIVLNPEGLFDASPGVMNSLYYVVGRDEIIELEQLKTRFYEPGLLQKVLGYSDEQTRPVEGLETIDLYPEVEAQIDGEILQINLQARNGGIGKVSIFINGKEVTEDANPLSPGENGVRATNIRYDLQADRQYLFHHPDSTNIISLRAYNAAGWLKSPAIELEYTAPLVRSRGSGRSEGGSAWVGQSDPKLYVISIGTSDYTGQKLDLKYADQDATMIARALHSVGTALFTNGDSLEIHCLSTAPTDQTGLANTPIHWQFATKKNIASVFKKITRQAKAEDVVVVYLSGHGLSYGSAEQAQFYYLTQGIANDDLSDVAVREAYTISSEEFTAWLNDIPALKQVLIIDACNSGQIVENLTSGTKALNSSQIRALDRMKDRTGMFVLSGSASDKVSYEASEYGQGLLTYALLQGMLGMATRQTADGNYIDVMKLFQHARDEVPRLAATINGIQTPMLGFPQTGASFDIGIVDENARIPIGSKKPVMIRSNFLNQVTLQDDLGLVKLLEAEFREETEKGKDADLIYVDVTEYPGAYSLSGLYDRDGSEIKLTIKLFKSGEDPQDLEIPPTDDPVRLVRLIMREVKRAIK